MVSRGPSLRSSLRVKPQVQRARQSGGCRRRKRESFTPPTVFQAWGWLSHYGLSRYRMHEPINHINRAHVIFDDVCSTPHRDHYPWLFNSREIILHHLWSINKSKYGEPGTFACVDSSCGNLQVQHEHSLTPKKIRSNVTTACFKKVGMCAHRGN